MLENYTRHIIRLLEVAIKRIILKEFIQESYKVERNQDGNELFIGNHVVWR